LRIRHFGRRLFWWVIGYEVENMKTTFLLRFYFVIVWSGAVYAEVVTDGSVGKNTEFVRADDYSAEFRHNERR
jgi:hypothetical protein